MCVCVCVCVCVCGEGTTTETVHVKHVPWLWCRLTNIVADIGGGVSEDSVDELTDDLLVYNGMDLWEISRNMAAKQFICGPGT